jgi:tetratricopeptide (TPR) repeat protein
MGRLTEAVDEMKRAQELDPLSLIINTDLGHILYFARRYDEAIAQYRKVLELDPNFAIARWRLGETYIQKGFYDEAIAELNRARELNNEDRRLVGWLAYAYAVAKQPDKARSLLNQLEQESREAHAYKIAFIHAGLDDDEQAFTWLQRAVAGHNAEMAPFKVEPMFDSLRNDSRFAQLLARMNLAA